MNAKAWEDRARKAGWEIMKDDIAELLGLTPVPGVTRFHKNSLRGDLTYSCNKIGPAAWNKLCKEEDL
jgi:hypothetical protein